MTIRVGPRRGGALLILLAAVVLILVAGAATAQAEPRERVGQVVVIGVPGLRWSDVQASPELTALVNESQVGSIAVKAAGPHTCPVDGWLTVSAGTRAWGSDPDQPCGDLPAVRDGRITDWQRYVDQQAEHHTGAVPGRIGDDKRRVCGFGPGAAIAVADKDGVVSDWQPEFDPATLRNCPDAIIDAGPLPLREGRAEARAELAELVRQVRAEDGWVVLAGISEETATAQPQLLAALQLPPDHGPRWLTSGSTRRPGLIQLTDLTATVLHGESGTDTPLDGDEVTFTGDPHPDAAAVIQDRLDTNERFEHPRPVLLLVLPTLILPQLAALGWFLLGRGRWPRRTLVFLVRSQTSFFTAVFLCTATGWWRWPEPGLSLYLVVLGISLAVAAAATAAGRRLAYLVIAAVGFAVLVVDGVLGTPLQFGSLFADGPVFGGRFYGFGNTTFATFAVFTLVTAGAAAQLLLARSRTAAAGAVLAIGGLAVLVDGVPGWGTDFGGIIALTPAVLLLAWLTWRDGISWRALIGVGLTGFLAVAAFAFADYQRPPAERSHFGTFVARLLDGDVSDVLVRKLQVSASLFAGPAGWAMLLPVVLGIAGVVAPDKVPSAPYRRLVAEVPMVRPTLLAMAVCGVVGMLLNDEGVVLPVIMVGIVVTLLVAHLVDNPPGPPTDPRTFPVEVSDGRPQ